MQLLAFLDTNMLVLPTPNFALQWNIGFKVVVAWRPAESELPAHLYCVPPPVACIVLIVGRGVV